MIDKEEDKKDPVAFVEKYTEKELYPFQKKILELITKDRFKLLGGRRQR